jgi:GAF domain-containing protein
VALTGQPLAVSNVRQDPRFKQDFAESTGYVPRSILATPLLHGERVLGVMEVLDKISAPSFGMQDMELLAVFAHQAALAIHQSQQAEQMGAVLLDGLRELAGEAAEPEVLRALRPEYLDGGSADEAAPDLAELAGLFYGLSAAGPAERRMALQVLAAVSEYAQSQPRLDF